MKNYDMIIIGSGISASSMAIDLALKNKKILVLEKSKYFGGAIQSCNYNDYSFELGSHTIYHSYSNLIKLIEKSNFENIIKKSIKQKYYFHKENQLNKITLNLNKLELTYNMLKSLKLKKEYLTVKEYYSKKFGEKNYTNFTKNFLKAVLCQNPDNFPSSIVLKKRKNKNKNYPKHINFDKGLQTIINNFLNHKNIKIINNMEVINILKDKDYFILNCKNSKFKSKNISISTQVNNASHLCQNISPNLKNLLDKINYTKLNSLSIVVNKNIKTPLFSGIIFNDKNFNSIVSRDNLFNKNYRAFTIHSEKENNKEILINKIMDVLSIDKKDILNSYFKTATLPSFTKNHVKIVNQIIKEVKTINGLYLTGNYFYGLSIEDCVIRSKEEMHRFIKTQN